jgi:hypothetical protein
MPKQITIIDYDEYYWVLTQDGKGVAMDVANSIKELFPIIASRLSKPLNLTEEMFHEDHQPISYDDVKAEQPKRKL